MNNEPIALQLADALLRNNQQSINIEAAAELRMQNNALINADDTRNRLIRRVTELEARIAELEAQLEAIGAGGVELLRKRECLHQISEPAQAAPASIITASVMRDDGGEHPAFCLMVAYRAEKDAKAALAMLTDEPAQAAAPDMTDAYAGAREDLSIWKKRALEAEALNRKFAASVNSPSFMGEPAAPIAPAREPLTDEQIDEIHLANSDAYERGDVEYESHGFARAIEHHHGITAAQKGGQHGTE